VKGERQQRVVAAVGTFNEASFLPRWLNAIAEIADDVVVVDDGSTDATVNILREHPLVSEVHTKKRGKRSEVADRRRMTRMALDHGADWIVFLDGDEVFDTRITSVLPAMLDADDVGEYRFRKYSLWRSDEQIRVDRPEKFSAWSPCRLVRASPKLRWRYPDGSDWRRIAKVAIRNTRWRPQYGHREIEGIAGKVAYVPPETAVIVHYAFVDFERVLRKQIRYAVGEREEHPRRDADEIADWAFATIDESRLELAPIPHEWKPLP
jgi:glycosyltransferase involved in cell wall biosynthesis